LVEQRSLQGKIAQKTTAQETTPQETTTLPDSTGA